MQLISLFAVLTYNHKSLMITGRLPGAGMASAAPGPIDKARIPRQVPRKT